jgi:ABC transporter, phosphonate, periplasmic substrate-binding protein
MQKCRHFSLIFLILLAVNFALTAIAGDSRATKLFYFNPDSPQSNLSRLKRDMDNFLAYSNFSVSFQPFAHLIDFEKQLKEKPPAFLFVPDWYLKRYGPNLNLHPLLIPVRNGKTTYRKVLLATEGTTVDLTKMPHLTVAMTSMGPDGDAILKEMLALRGAASYQVNTIIVPKDMDALFALALGQVDMALVVKENIDQVAKINPNILRSIHPVLESKPIPMPVLCFTEGVASSSDIQELKDIFLKHRKNNHRSDIMEMLQFNDWQAVTN